MHIARLLVDKLGKWTRFSGRSLNSHSQSLESYRRLLAVWKPMWDAKVKNVGDYKFSANDLIKILRERIHPENRQPTANGDWTLKS
jgi:hypothetical protein